MKNSLCCKTIYCASVYFFLTFAYANVITVIFTDAFRTKVMMMMNGIHVKLPGFVLCSLQIAVRMTS